MKSTKVVFSSVFAFAIALLISFSLATPSAFADDGDFDNSFGVDGLLTTDFNNFGDSAFDIALQPDGKIVAAGTSQVNGTDYDFSVARYNTNGSLDTSFSGDGRVTTSLSAGSDLILAITLQPDGKILAVGYCGSGSLSFYGMARYNSDGSLDTSFGGGAGKICGTQAITLSGVALQPDGKFVASGYGTATSEFDFVVARFNADGTFDTSFGTQGQVVVELMGGSDAAYDVLLQPDGKILATGTAQFTGVDYDVPIVRLESDGDLDESFGEHGLVIINYDGGDDGARALALNPDGKIYLAGYFFTSGTGYDFAVIRLLPSGDVDNSFDGDGLFTFTIGAGTSLDQAHDLILQPDGKIVVAGQTEAPGEIVFATARILPVGTLDTTYALSGIEFHHFDNSNEAIARSIIIQPDGKLIAGGSAFVLGNHTQDYALTRYLSGSAVTPTPTSTSVATATPTSPAATSTRTNTPPPGSTSTRTPTRTPTTNATSTSTATLPPNATPTSTPTVCTIEYTDVPQGSTFYSFVHCLACRGIIGGYETGCETGNPCFRPNNNLTRGQLSKIVSNAAGYTEGHSTSTFEDVPVGSTFHLFVERLATRSIIGGYACGGPGEPCGTQNKPYFRPNANVTRGQTSKIIAIARNLPAPSPGQQSFEDVATTHTFWQWIEALFTSGAINGYACGGPGEPCGGGNLPYFRPSNNVTRGQASKIISLAFFPGCGEQSIRNK